MINKEETQMNLSPEIEPREFVEVTKNSKGYNWTIKIMIDKHIDTMHQLFDEKALARIEAIDKICKDKYGSELL